MKLSFAAVAAFTFFLAQPALAGFYIEPGVFYEKGESEINWPVPFAQSSTGDTEGYGGSLKVGYHNQEKFFMGLEGIYSQPQFKNSVNHYEADASSSLFGVVLGTQMTPIGLRIWGGYIFEGTLDPEADNEVDIKFDGARGPKFGLGLKIYSISVNVEYMDIEYRDTLLENAGAIGELFESKFKNKTTLISVSMPLTL